MTAETARPSGEENYVSKLTVQTLGCVPAMVKTLKPEEGNKIAIARLYGIAARVAYQEDKTQGVIHTYFAGNFEGINLQDGTTLRSGKMFLPKGISEVVEQAIKTAQAKDDKASISFAFEIRAVRANNPAGYSYEASALKSPQEEDQLAEMRSMIAKLPTHEQKALAGKTQTKQIEGQQASRKSA